eukprot:7379775-Prymnesium_polylepis.1
MARVCETRERRERGPTQRSSTPSRRRHGPRVRHAWQGSGIAFVYIRTRTPLNHSVLALRIGCVALAVGGLSSGEGGETVSPFSNSFCMPQFSHFSPDNHRDRQFAVQLYVYRTEYRSAPSI